MNDFKILIVDKRIKEAKRNTKYFYYDLRHGDSDFGKPVTLEKRVIVNHYGTLISTKPLEKLFASNRDYYQLTNKAILAIHDFVYKHQFLNGQLLFPKN